MSQGSKIVSSALLGLDIKTIVVNGKAYVVHPPTIKKLSGAAYYLSDIEEGNDVSAVLRTITGGAPSAAKALSWLIQGDEELYKEFEDATLEEIAKGLETALSLISTEGFIRLSGLTRSVATLIAKPKW